MAHFKNPHRPGGLAPEQTGAVLPSDDESAVADLLALCPAHRETPLRDLPGLAERAGFGRISVKDERGRMGLGSFKALGAAYCIARDAAEAGGGAWSGALSGSVYATASAGNHGLSVAAGARLFGARARVYLAKTVPEAFAERLRAKGAEVVRAGESYEESMEAAERDAASNGWNLLSDSSWPGYTDRPYRVMEGYLQLAAEAARQVPEPPDHIFLQAGVGGLAAAVAAHARKTWGARPVITVVEPEAAPCLMEGARAGRVIDTTGPVSGMGRLDCKTASMIALAGLCRDADHFVTVSEAAAREAVQILDGLGLPSTASGSAGVAGLLSGAVGCASDAHVLVFLSEGPEDG